MKLPPCVVGIEACTSSHFWARELTALGHDAKLMPSAFVKTLVKAVQRPSMRFVPIKQPEQQAGLGCCTERGISSSAS